jgi:dTDP-glucose pyrophosphorylase
MIEAKLLSQQTIRDAIAVIERTRSFIAAIVNADGMLQGIVSDGDVRRALLAGHGLDDSVTKAMTVRPLLGDVSATPEALQRRMFELGVAALPVVDSYGRFVRIVQVNDEHPGPGVASKADRYWGAVIMAGGEGRRLRPMTANLPKPMIPVGGMPLLERQIRGMVLRGIRRIFISTNYLGHIIEDHFGDGSAFDAEIVYLREKEKLGTAGALSLMPERAQGPLLVINGDILTTSDYGRMLDFHVEHGDFLTVAAIDYRVEIPFGVIKTSGVCAIGLEEKPLQHYLCNAGIYVLSPPALDMVPQGRFYNMTDLITTVIAGKRPVSVFPIHEYWTDIGSPKDLIAAQDIFQRNQQ